MHLAINKNQLTKLLIILGIIIVLPLTLFLSKQRQEMRKRAAGTGEVEVMLAPFSGNYLRNDVFLVNIMLHKKAARNILFSGAQMTLLASDKFVVSSPACIPPFDVLTYVNISGQTATFMCALAPGAVAESLVSDRTVASFVLTVKPTATLGEAPVSFTATRVTEANVPNDVPDVSTAGQAANYNIVNPTPTSTPIPPTPTPTRTPTPIPPTPTFTPTPTKTPTPIPPTPTKTPVPTPTFTPSPTKTPTPLPTNTPTPTPYPCPAGTLGNLDCSLNGCIDTADYELFRQAFGKKVSEIIVLPHHSNPDLVKDNDNMINDADFEILRQNFGACKQ